MKFDTFGPVPSALVGDSRPSVRPGDDPSLYGSANLTPVWPVETRSFQTFKLTYTVGKLGIDDTGGIQVAFRFIGDAGKAQTSDPTGPNYVAAKSNGAGRINLEVREKGPRPWKLLVTAYQSGGYLKEGEQIEITFGDTTHGSPGMVMQTFVEAGYEFRVSTDVQATGNFLPLATQHAVPVVAGPPHQWKAIVPTLRRPGETFQLGLKAEDVWGNPTAQARGRVRLEPSIPVKGLPLEFAYAPDDRAMTFEGLSVSDEGQLRIQVYVDDIKVAEAGPLIVRKSDVAGFWGDLHGQSGETVGIGQIESYFDFARNKSFLDVTSHQGNDFQINNTFWAHLNSLTAALDEPGRFVVFPGYEWSGNTAVGGDHNVFFRHEGCQIRRCSHALLEDRSGVDTDCHTLTELYAALSEEDSVMYAHVGGRYANIAYDHNPRLETAVEVHSAWGTFEWILTDGFKLGRRVGVVANSDGHKGRPGASYPGSSTFGSYGGLTCFLTDQLDRDSIFEAMRRRHHYGTTGCRMHIDVRADIPGGGTLYERDPRADPTAKKHSVTSVRMGDIVQTEAMSIEFSVAVAAHAGIERIEIRNAERTLETIRPYNETDVGNRIRLLWSGAEYRGRGRNTTWRGRAQFRDATIERFETINRWNPERLFEQRGSNSIVWDTITTGNFMGFDVWLRESGKSSVAVATNHGDLSVNLEDIGTSDVVLDAGGLARRLRLFRLPTEPLKREMSFSRKIQLNETGDTPVWICVTTEDGYQAWSSPIYLFHPNG
ncbi:MAG TPA: DUF3604 domain-containing protein [Hyphomicrobiaceae bacterium]|nr:DUF3604 domain-containing protein [Hyphomicrobiaceae bacterium]